MKIDRTDGAEAVRLRLSGRLDAASSDPVAAALEEAVRSGRSRIELDLAEVAFMSSVGIGVVVAALGRFRAVGGVLSVIDASEAVRKMLRIARLESLLAVPAPSSGAVRSSARPFNGGGDADRFEGELQAVGRGTASIERIGPGRLVAVKDVLALGRLALAESAAAAKGRFGEALVAGGTIAVMPAEASRPDCLASGGRESVEAVSLDALVVRGAASLQGFFESRGARGAGVGDLALALATAAEGPIGFLLAGECGGAFGAWARSSPDGWSTPLASMDAASIRRAVRHAGEPIEEGETAVVAGVACRRGDLARLGPVGEELSPIDPLDLALHAHVAVASYRPLPRTATDLAVVGSILAEQPLRVVLHALRQPRPDGVVETRLRRGSAWAFRLAPEGRA